WSKVPICEIVTPGSTAPQGVADFTVVVAIRGSRSLDAARASQLARYGEWMARIDEIVDGVYRISIPPRDAPISFNQFLIDDERPALVHTGVHSTYEETRRAVAEVVDPARLAYVVLLHFEGDECGGMDRFMAAARQAELVGCQLSVV